ncbi:Cytochrome P450 [Popillia japonica]|uniref:Cytochrome P450 n=1 Tax=Popillia japonica TaxID=7064 RepID=A0AAW1MDC6_POPJA
MSYLKWRREIYEPLKKLSVITWIPYFGTKYIFMGVKREELFSYAINLVKQHSPLFCVWSGTEPEIAVTTPEHLEIIMNNSDHITKGNQYQKLLPWLGQGLLTSTGERWFQHRKLITPTFHFKILEHFMEVFVEKTGALLKILDTKANGEAFNAYPDITHCALDIICETAMGVQINAMSSKQNEYVASVYGISEIVVWRMLRPYLSVMVINQLIMLCLKN